MSAPIDLHVFRDNLNMYVKCVADFIYGFNNAPATFTSDEIINTLGNSRYEVILKSILFQRIIAILEASTLSNKKIKKWWFGLYEECEKLTKLGHENYPDLALFLHSIDLENLNINVESENYKLFFIPKKLEQSQKVDLWKAAERRLHILIDNVKGSAIQLLGNSKTLRCNISNSSLLSVLHEELDGVNSDAYQKPLVVHKCRGDYGFYALFSEDIMHARRLKIYYDNDKTEREISVENFLLLYPKISQKDIRGLEFHVFPEYLYGELLFSSASELLRLGKAYNIYHEKGSPLFKELVTTEDIWSFLFQEIKEEVMIDNLHQYERNLCNKIDLIHKESIELSHVSPDGISARDICQILVDSKVYGNYDRSKKHSVQKILDELNIEPIVKGGRNGASLYPLESIINECANIVARACRYQRKLVECTYEIKRTALNKFKNY